MASYANINIVGYVGREPEMRYTPNGTAVTNFSVATTERRKVKGESQDITTWFRVSLFGQQAETAAKFVKKGDQIGIVGTLSQQEYTDRDGAVRTSLEVRTSQLHLMQPREADVPHAEEHEDALPFDATTSSEAKVEGETTTEGEPANQAGAGSFSL